MAIRKIRAVLCFITPTGGLCKDINWSHYEAKANLTTSTTSSEAFNRFIINAKKIINSSKLELRYLYSISFYEEIRKKGANIKRRPTKTIEVGKDMKLKVLEK